MHSRVVGSLLALGLLACARQSFLSHVGEAPPAIDSTRNSRTKNTLYLINGRQLATGRSVRELDPAQIVSIEHFIGPAALRYGVGSDSDVVVISTHDTLAAISLTIPWRVHEAVVARSDSGPMILINGKALLPGHTVQELNTQSIVSVDVYRGPAALLLGATRDQSVVVISTRDSLAAIRLTRP